MRWLTWVGLTLVLLAALGPRWGVERVQRVGVDATVWFVVDVSRSMLVEDVGGSRLEAARRLAGSLLPAIEGGRAAVVAFAGEPRLVCPPSSDLRYIAPLLASLDRDSAPGGGSDLQKAVRLAASRADPSRGDVVVLISDGGDDGQSSPSDPAEERIPILAVGVGDAERGGLVPGDQPGAWLRERGRLVESRRNDRVLEQIARRSGGSWLAAGRDSAEAENLLRRSLSKRLKSEEGEAAPAERYRWFLAPGFVLLSIAALRFRGVAAAVALIVATPPGRALAADEPASLQARADAAYLDRRWNEAEPLFQSLANAGGPRADRNRFALANTLFHRAVDGEARDADVLLAAIAEYRRLLDHSKAEPPAGFTEVDVRYNLLLAKRLLPPPPEKGDSPRPTDRDPAKGKEEEGDVDSDGKPRKSNRKPNGKESNEKQGGAVVDPIAGVAVDDPGPLTPEQARIRLRAALEKMPKPQAKVGATGRTKPGDY